jgi:hypothetical protein
MSIDEKILKVRELVNEYNTVMDELDDDSHVLAGIISQQTQDTMQQYIEY